MVRSRPPKRGTAAAAVCAVLAVFALASPAQAIELEFSRPAPCPTDEITFRVEKAIAQPLASIAGPTFRVSIERARVGYLGRVEVPPARGDAARSSERRVTARSCDELVDTVALTLVLAIAGHRDSRAEPEADSSPTVLGDDGGNLHDVAAPDPVSATAEGRVPDETLATASDPASARLFAFGAMIGDAGSLPSLALGVAVGAAVAWPSVELRALGTFLPGAEGSVDARDPASPGAELGLIAGGLLVCAPLSTRVAGAELGACVGAELGRLSGHGTRIDTPHSSATWWSAPRADLGARWALPVHWLSLELGLAVAAPIWRDEFVLDGVGSVHRAAAVVGRAGLSLRADFGQ